MKRYLLLWWIIFSLNGAVSAQQFTSEPEYRIAYLEAQLEGIRNLPEEERFQVLSYTRSVNREYSAMVQRLITTRINLERLGKGTDESNPAAEDLTRELERLQKNLNKETDRFLGYFELELTTGKKALQHMTEVEYQGYLRRDYYQILFDAILLEELRKMPEEELFLYLSDRGPVNYGFRELVTELVIAQASLAKLQSTEPNEPSERMLRLQENIEEMQSGLREETSRLLKAYEFNLANAQRAMTVARKRLEEEESGKNPKI